MSATERSTTATVLIAALALLVTFVAGFVVGAVADRFILLHGRPGHPPPMMARAMIHRLDRQLDLSDQQREQIEKILERHHEAIMQHVHADLQSANAEIEALLTPEQRRKFQQLKLRLGPDMHPEGRRRREPTR